MAVNFVGVTRHWPAYFAGSGQSVTRSLAAFGEIADLNAFAVFPCDGSSAMQDPGRRPLFSRSNG